MEENSRKNFSEKISDNDESLTIEKFRKLTGLDSISDADAQATILAINCLVNILIEHDLEEEQAKNNETEYNLKQAA